MEVGVVVVVVAAAAAQVVVIMRVVEGAWAKAQMQPLWREGEEEEGGEGGYVDLP